MWKIGGKLFELVQTKSGSTPLQEWHLNDQLQNASIGDDVSRRTS
jgi:hypothetical protein